jgi:glucose/arabinose dehydrogenase
MPAAAPARPPCERLEPRRLFSVIPGFTQSTLVTGVRQPTAIEFAPDGRLFVTEQAGGLRVVKDGQLLPEPAVTIDADGSSERGLLGIAFAPDFVTSGDLYLYYTAETPTTHNRVSRFRLTGDTVDVASEQVVLNLPTVVAGNHNGGSIHFGPDGKLYVATGENGNPPLAQSLDSPLGKILRVNPDGSTPADNPFLDRTAGQNQLIWALGLRNPYQSAFDPATGRLFIDDVGQSSFEEVNVGSAGANYGWPIIEGKRTGETAPDGYVDPLVAYPRSVGTSITGGTYYRAAAGAAAPFPASFDGTYFISDLGSGVVKAVDTATGALSDFAGGLNTPTDLTVGPDGGLYVAEYLTGRIIRFSAAGTDVAAEVVRGPVAQALAGQKDTVVVRLTNAGEARLTGRVTVDFSLTPTDSAGPALTLATVAKTLRLKPGQGKLVRATFRYPAGADGTFTVSAAVRGAAALGDADASNDVATAGGPVTVRPPFVDLRPVIPDLSAQVVRADRRSTVTIRVANAGNVPFRGKTTVRLRASADATAGDDDPTISDGSSPRLTIAAGRDKALRFRVMGQGSLSSLVPGTYFLVVELDREGSEIESDDSNNLLVSAGALTVV